MRSSASFARAPSSTRRVEFVRILRLYMRMSPAQRQAFIGVGEQLARRQASDERHLRLVPKPEALRA